ncbi:transcriptional regulator [Actinoplanes cyaneus]|uniref:Transcriptional regulator n=1 Tax=Actinoplanes cyaneus TaxID=52696 RepID=A0A919MA26_9ACTN|nr:GAF and ANTAR domain-containing protein [Actinoplanes cyaneus]MCW2140728.1 GAF domain-containing protein [Actinoplanes cyaneus]GID70073.1 transcriptional regulator [Actinoplanes cyaneus]
MPYDPMDPLAVFAELGRTKLIETSLDDLLNRVASMARRALPGAAEVSVTLVRRDVPYTAAYTGELALKLDERQYEHHRGPCLQAAAEQKTISVPDTATDSRWDGWAERAAAAGAGSVLSVGLPVHDDISGALNIYGDRPGAFDHDSVTLAQSLAGYAAVALANVHLYHHTNEMVRHMQTAMESRAVIEQAKGIIMAERRCNADDAFAVLTTISQNTNRKVRDVAAALVSGIRSQP